MAGVSTLSSYRRRRDFRKSPEPKGSLAKGDRRRFVIHEHHATRLHFDLRLKLHGVLKCWVVPKGPSLNPKDLRLAVRTEDYPVKYIDFHGSIPEGQYGAGTTSRKTCHRSPPWKDPPRPRILP